MGKKIGLFFLTVIGLFILISGIWIWKGPSTIQKNMPELLKVFAPEFSSDFSYDSVKVHRNGTVLFWGVELNISDSTNHLDISIPELETEFDIRSALSFSPSINSMQAAEIKVHTNLDSLNPSFSLLDSLLNKTIQTRDFHLFQNTSILFEKILFNNVDTLKHFEFFVQTFPQRLSFKSRFSGKLTHPKASVQFQNLNINLSKENSQHISFDSIYSESMAIDIPTETYELQSRSALLDTLLCPFNFSWTKYFHNTSILFDQLDIQQSHRADLKFLNFSPEFTIKKDTAFMKFDFNLKGWLRSDQIQISSASISTQTDLKTKKLEIPLFKANKLRIHSRGFQGFKNKKSLINYLTELHLQKPLQLFSKTLFNIDTLDYQNKNRSMVLAEQLQINPILDSTFSFTKGYRLNAKKINASYRGDGFFFSNGGFHINFPQNPQTEQTTIKNIKVDTLGLSLSATRLKSGPKTVLEDLHNLSTQKIWASVLPFEPIVNTYLFNIGDKIQIESQGLQWEISQERSLFSKKQSQRKHLREKAFILDSLRIQANWKKLKVSGAFRENSWLRALLQKKSQTLFNPSYLDTKCNILHFSKGKYLFAQSKKGYQIEVALGKSKEFGGRFHGEFRADQYQRNKHSQTWKRIARNKQILHGDFRISYLKLSRITPLILPSDSPTKISGSLNLSLQAQIPIRKLNQFKGFKGTAKINMHQVEVQKSHLQRQEFLNIRAPEFKKPIKFQSISIWGITINDRKIRFKNIKALGTQLDFNGWGNAKYNGAFYLRAKMNIHPKSANDLPHLTRNGMKKSKDGGRTANITIHGNPTWQKFSNKGTLVGSAVLNNIKSGFGLFD